MWYYHVTPLSKIQSIGRHGLLNGKQALKLGVGEQTTGWECGAPFIHVTDNLAAAIRWFREVFLLADVTSAIDELWAIIRFDASAVDARPRRDPKSQTGLVFELDCIPPEVLSYCLGDYLQEDLEYSDSMWKPLTLD